MYVPSAVTFNITAAIATQTAAIIIGVGMMPQYAPKNWKEGTRTYTILLLHKRSPIALPADQRISVATMGCIFI
ncbi:hypothetical protein IMSAG025_01526 [Muribaculaceae bacterium]|nr:hypothetical protein IMSAG025_01526 [Muribaculaceae bacterium]